MAVKFFNIKTGETIEAESEPHISALWNSSDRGPNANNHQDFGWRLAPEVIAQVKKLRNDPGFIERLALKMQKDMSLIEDTDILTHIAYLEEQQIEMSSEQNDYSEVYEKEVKKHLSKSSQTDDKKVK